MIKHEPENNPFKYIYCDIVHRCNMECANCYLPNRDLPDIPKILLIDFFQKFKKSTEFRFIGGEPTLHKDLPELIEVATSLGHRTTIATNGLRTSRFNYLSKLKNAGLKTVYLSMTGWDNDNIYKITDKMKCATKKMITLQNALKLRLRISVGTIIIKGMNEEVIDKIKASINTFNYKAGTSFEFRNVGQVGRYMIGKDENYSFDELKKLIISQVEPTGGVFEDSQYIFSYKYHKYRINITNW